MAALSEKQKAGLWLGIALAIAMGSYPPWQIGGAPGPYAPIWEPPHAAAGQPAPQLDMMRLLVQWAMAGFIALGVILTGQEGNAAGAGQNTVPETSSAVATLEEPAPELVVLKFPDKSIGEVLLESAEDPDYWDSLSAAKGSVKVPAAARVQLEITRSGDLGCLARPEMTAIVSVDASNSKIGDDDVYCIAALRNLEELDLSNTNVTDHGVKALASLSSLQKIWLDGTQVTAESVNILKDLPNLKKVSLVQTSVDDSQIISLKEERAGQCEVVLRDANPA